MKINFQFNQSVFLRNKMPFNWSPYSCDFFDEISKNLSNNPEMKLDFFSDVSIKNKSKLILYLNTLDEFSFIECNELINKSHKKEIFFIKSLNSYTENEYSLKLELLLKAISANEMDLSPLFKSSNTSAFNVYIASAVVENCRCPILNTLLSHGAGVLKFKSPPTLICRSFKLSFQHGVRLVVIK